jgi:hypothetical protein
MTAEAAGESEIWPVFLLPADRPSAWGARARGWGSIVRFRSAVITVCIGLDRLRCDRRMGSIEGLSPLLIRATGRYGPIPGVRSGRARRCKS